jgi:hypothetical protein
MTPNLSTRACAHHNLQFGSGGFYLLCVTCGARWAAEKTTDGRSVPDYDRVDAALNGQRRGK